MVSQTSINNTIQDNDFSVNRATAATTVQSSVDHSDNTSGTSNAKFFSQVGGTSGGDPHLNVNIPATQDYALGIDNTDADNLKITDGADPSSGSTYATFDQGTTNVWFDGISFDGGTTILANYEENTTFTPVLEFGGGTTGITYSTQTGKYARIGNIVFVRINLVLTSKGSDTGAATITGLPFSVLTTPEPVVALRCANITFGSTGTAISANLIAGPAIEFYGLTTSANFEALDDTDFADNSRMLVTGWYETA